jgi:hypothetical protein
VVVVEAVLITLLETQVAQEEEVLAETAVQAESLEPQTEAVAVVLAVVLAERQVLEVQELLLFLTHQHIHWQRLQALIPKPPLVATTFTHSLVLEQLRFKELTWDILQK